MATTDTSTLNIGTQIKGKHSYTIKRVLGRGGFGVTYEATATYMDGNIPQTMRYCVKEFYPQDVCFRQPDGRVKAIEGREEDFKSMKKHFVTEAELMREVCKHRGVVAINEVFDSMDTSYYIMEYIDGESLDTYIKTHGTMSESEALDIAQKLGEALTFLHSKYINHLDVKPDNIMLICGEKGQLQPILIDFGLSRRYRKNGTAASMINNSGVSEGYSPVEQYAGIDRFSPESDVYALAATMIYALTGHHPCESSQMNASWLKLNLPANLSTETEYALLQALKPRNERCQTVEAFIRLLPVESVKARSAVHVDPNLSPKTRCVRVDQDNGESSPNRSKGKVWIYIAMAVLGIALIALIVYAVTMPKDTSTEEESTPVISNTGTQADADAATIAEETVAVENQLIETAAAVEAKEPTHTPETKPSEKTVEAKEQPKTEPARKAEASKATKDANTETSPKEDKSTGKLSLGYATYEGKIVKGVPHGRGKLTFHSDHVIESYDPQKRMASEGDVVTGMFYDGHLTQGQIKRKDGSTERIVIGG